MELNKKVRFKEIINQLMQREQLSLHAVAQATKVNKSSLHNYLNGVLPQGLPAMLKLSELFNVTLDELIFGVPIKKNISIQKSILQEEHYEITIKKIHK